MDTRSPVSSVLCRLMIRGRVGPGQRAFVEVTLRGGDGQQVSVEAVLDTGFEGYLILTPDIIQRLGLDYPQGDSYILANGQPAQFPTYLATVSWHDRPRLVLVLESNGAPLLGASMLWGSRVILDMEEGGGVSIEEL